MNETTSVGGWSRSSAYTICILTLITSFNYFDRSILSLVLPQVKSDMSISDTTLGLITGLAFMIFYSLLGVPIARLADRTNRRNVIAIGLATWSVMTSLTGLASNVLQLTLLRLMMGVGEATNIAPSNSIIADLFDRKGRALALAIFGSGSAVASILLLPLAGLISLHLGWRMTFILSGIPGMVLALVLWRTINEPDRGHGARKPTGRGDDALGWKATARFFWGARSYLLLVVGGCMIGISFNASTVWTASFLNRVHHFDVLMIAATVGPVRGMAGVAGGLLAGFMVQYLEPGNTKWLLWIPAITSILTVPAELLMLFAQSPAVTIIGLALVGALTTATLGPVYSVCTSVATPGRRAVAVAIYLMCVNVVGLGLGPLMAGALNDRLAADFAENAIRYSLLICALFGGAGGVIYLLAARFLVEDIARANA